MLYSYVFIPQPTHSPKYFNSHISQIEFGGINLLNILNSSMPWHVANISDAKIYVYVCHLQQCSQIYQYFRAKKCENGLVFFKKDWVFLLNCRCLCFHCPMDRSEKHYWLWTLLRGVPRFRNSPWGGCPDFANTNYQKKPEIAQIRPWNTYRGVIVYIYIFAKVIFIMHQKC